MIFQKTKILHKRGFVSLFNLPNKKTTENKNCNCIHSVSYVKKHTEQKDEYKKKRLIQPENKYTR